MGDSNPLATFDVAEQAGRRKIAFLCTPERSAADWISPQLKKAFGGVLIVNEKFSKETAEATLETGAADAVAFGQLFIANPDLSARFNVDAPLNTPDPSTFYAQGPKGNTDYPALAREIVGAFDRRQRPAARRLATRSKASANSREPAIVIASPMRRSSSACSPEPVSPITILFT